jgi:hypothetical protein
VRLAREGRGGRGEWVGVVFGGPVGAWLPERNTVAAQTSVDLLL